MRLPQIHLFVFQIISPTEKHILPLKFQRKTCLLCTNPLTFMPFLVTKCRAQRTGDVTDAWGAHHSSSSSVSPVVQGMACLPFSFPQIISFFKNRKIATVWVFCLFVFKWICKWMSKSVKQKHPRNCIPDCETSCQSSLVCKPLANMEALEDNTYPPTQLVTHFNRYKMLFASLLWCYL